MKTNPTIANDLREQVICGAASDTTSEAHLTDLTAAVKAGTSQTAPIVTGQCAQVHDLIREHQPLLSFILTADHAIPEAAARIHDLRAMGFNIITTIKAEVEFRGCIRRKAGMYSIGVPEWPRPGFLDGSAP